MAFYLEKAIFVNRAPFEHLELDFKESGINVLAAINGRGKTTILSHITDAFYELAKLHFSGEFSDKEGKYYRISSSLYNIDLTKPSYVYLRFRNDDKSIDYIDIRNNCTIEEYDAAINLDNKIPFGKFSSQLQKRSTVKFWHIAGEDKGLLISSIFGNNILTYFPAYRHEKPSYLNDPYQFNIEYKIDSDFSGYLSNPIEVVTGLRYLANWIMDVVLDWENYKDIRNIRLADGTIQSIDNTPELKIWQNLNTVLRTTLSTKSSNEHVRLGIGKRNRGGSRISVVSEDGKTTISPNLNCLSSGETAMMCCFGELLRQADNIRPNASLESIYGIVLIDEIDKHLHIKLQKECLPKLFNLFPNVQFIVSAHSPFLNMGLADDALERTQIFDLDNNGIVCSPQNNPLYTEVYDLMVNENNRFYKQYKSIQSELENLNKPIIITEGKTDIIHILKAKEKLGIQTDFKSISENNQPDGDSNLQTLLEQLCKVEHHNKIIAIFDRDISKTVKNMDNNGVGYKSYGNNVYGFCISAPQCRIDNSQDDISIEYLYTDDEIHTILPNNCKLFFGTEFSEISGRHNTDKDIILKNQSDRGKRKIVENNGGQAVIDRDDNNILAKKVDFANAIANEDVAISQESWENFRHIFEKIEQIIQL